MITMGGQELVENNQNNIEDDRKIFENMEINRNKVKKGYIKQILMKLLEMLIDMIVTYISFLVCNLKMFDICFDFNYHHHSYSYKELCSTYNFSMFILFLSIGIIIYDIFKLFKYEDNYKFFGKIDKLLQETKEHRKNEIDNNIERNNYKIEDLEEKKKNMFLYLKTGNESYLKSTYIPHNKVEHSNFEKFIINTSINIMFILSATLIISLILYNYYYNK